MALAFLWNDRVAGAAMSVPSGVEPIAGMPLSSLIDPQLRVRCRWEADSAVLQLDFTFATDLDAVALLGTNLTVPAAVRWRVAGNSAMTAPSYDNTVATTPTAAGNGNIILLAGSTQSGRYMRLDIAAPGVAAIDIGRLVAGPLWTPSRHYGYGIQEGRAILDRRDTNPLTGAQFAVPAIANPRQASFGLDVLSGAEAIGQHRSLLDTLGGAGDVLWVPDTGLSQDELNRRCIWGPCNPPGGFAGHVHRAPGAYARSFTITERL